MVIGITTETMIPISFPIINNGHRLLDTMCKESFGKSHKKTTTTRTSSNMRAKSLIIYVMMKKIEVLVGIIGIMDRKNHGYIRV